MRKQRWRCRLLWTNPHPLTFPSFPVASLTFHHIICCLFEATKQRRLSWSILSKDATTRATRVGVEPKSRDR